VLGIGNVLWADEGFGVRAVEALHASWRFPAHVRLMDGGTQGMALLSYVREAERLLILDAVDFGLAPGSLRLILDDAVPSYLGAKKVSMHQTGFQEVLASARMLDDLPGALALIGVQPVEIDDYGGSLRPEVRARLPEAVNLAVDILSAWGASPERRDGPLPAWELTGPAALDLPVYEANRPSSA
jgi:hydrogenase maturation protease